MPTFNVPFKEYQWVSILATPELRKSGYRPHNSNPCKNTRRYKMKPMERFLSAEEMARLNAVLTRDEFWCPNAVAIVRLLMLTGCRFGEIAALEWDWIRDRRIHLPDSKSGPRTVWLSSAARAVIDVIPRYGPDCPYLYPARPPTRPIHNIAFQWDRIRAEAGLPGPRLLHDLRHSWASTAAMNGVDMVTIAKLLGHALVETTAGYAHLDDARLVKAAEKVGKMIAKAIELPSPKPQDFFTDMLSATKGKLCSLWGGISAVWRIHRTSPRINSCAPGNGRKYGSALGSCSRNEAFSSLEKVRFPSSSGWVPVISRPMPLIGALSSRTTRCGSDNPPASNRYGDSAAWRLSSGSPLMSG